MSESEAPPEVIAKKSTQRGTELANPERRAFLSRLMPKSKDTEVVQKTVDKVDRKSTSDQSIKSPEISPEISRRNFLKRMVAGAVVPFVPNTDRVFAQEPESTSSTEYGEVLKPSDRVILVDMSPDFDNQSMMQNLLGELYAEDLDLESIDTRSNISRYIASGNDRVVATLLANEFLRSRARHGEAMAGKYVETISNLGFDVEAPKILPLQKAFGRMEFSRDDLGNPSIIMEIDEQKIGDMLEQYFTENPKVWCVNLSLQIGRGRTKQILRQVIPLSRTNEFEIYDEATDTEFVTVATDIHSWAVAPDERFLPHRMIEGTLTPLGDDELLSPEQFAQLNEQHERDIIADYQAGRATDQIEDVYRNETTEMYNPEFARENLSRLIALCRRFPDKSFNVSGGNVNSFFYEIRQEMEAAGEWANNLTILAGEEDKSDGADIYLEEYRFNRMIPISSSESAVIVSALDSLLANQGIPLGERQQRIQRYCQPLEFKTNAGNVRKALSLDPNFFTQELSNQAQ